MPLEGFWAQSPAEKTDLPFPESSREDWGKEAFLAQLDKVEANARARNYRGWSVCRICKCNNGSAEYIFEDFRWPAGFRHYVAEHNVRPSPEFEKMIQETSAGLPDRLTIGLGDLQRLNPCSPEVL